MADRVRYQVRLTVTGRDPDEGYNPDAELVIETPFLLRDGHGDWHEMDPGTGSALAPQLDLFMRTITAVDLDKRGTMTLGFNDGAQLVVTAHPQFESWHLTGMGFPQITAGPGGYWHSQGIEPGGKCAGCARFAWLPSPGEFR